MALAQDASAFGDAGGKTNSSVSATISTTGSNRVLLAFLTLRNGSTNYTPTFTSTTLTWTQVQVTATGSGVLRGYCTIFRAFASSQLTSEVVTATAGSSDTTLMLAVIAFSGADTTGTNGSGAIGANGTANGTVSATTESVTTTRANSWVWGVGAASGVATRTLGSGQTMVHELSDTASSAGDYWCECETSVTPTSGTSVTLNATSPTNNNWSFCIVEVLPSLADTMPPYTLQLHQPSFAHFKPTIVVC